MKKQILDLGKTLNREEQKQINGGFSCPTYDASHCILCGGHPLSNGCCLGTKETHMCLSGGIFE
ncbi:hypothetical protein ACQY1Q_11980 [Tenacibaculum sp. TC6]|uniref:hypothetical protein n=1 Tax=Tenacibaculum sp. TC6 TaxID=3423223 RepID=UPI003D35FC7A